MRILVTRPEPDGERTAAELRARGHEVLLAPLLQIETMSPDLGAGPWAAVLLSSANGARAVAAHPRRADVTRCPVFTVGRSSAEAARTAGFTEVVSADGDAHDLVRLVAGRLAGCHAPVLYVAGADRSADIAGALTGQGVLVETVVAYRAVAVRAFPADVHAAVAAGQIDAVLHFSPRSARTFVSIAQTADLLDKSLNCLHYCISAQVAGVIGAAGGQRVMVAARPDAGALLDLVSNG